MKTETSIVKRSFCKIPLLCAAQVLSATVCGVAFAGDVPKLDVGIFENPIEIQQLGPFGTFGGPDKAAHPGDLTELTDRKSFREMNPDGMPLIGYAYSMSSFPWTTDGKEYGLSEGVWYLLRNDKMMARFVWHPQPRKAVPRLSYEAALFLYPANPDLTHMWSPSAILAKPFAVLTIENDTASPAPFFCAFTPESHLNFGLCQRPKTEQEAARFFFEFLCEHPEKEVYCLGSDEWNVDENVGIRKSFEMATFKLWDASKDISPEDVLKEMKPQIDKAKAESRAMAEKYDMVLWPEDKKRCINDATPETAKARQE